MKIHKMTASFGSLQNQSMELSDGLNIIAAPNEGGKSTWCAFIKAMLYGIDSSAREKAGVKPDKIKFAPWNGGSMCGTMDIEFGGNEITLSRQGKGGAPMRTFSANYAGSAESAPIPQSLVGETLLGIPREVFERSAFIGQGDMEMSQSPELEKRIASIVQTGDQGSSAIEAGDTLRAAMRRRRHNKSGRLPEIEAEVSAIRGTLMEIERLKQQGADLAAARGNALSKRDELTEKVAEGRRTQRRSSLEELSANRSRFGALEAEQDAKTRAAILAEAKLRSGPFGMADPEESRRRVGEVSAHQNELFAAAKKGGSFARSLAFVLIFAVIAAGLELAAEFNLFFLVSKLVSRIPGIIAGILCLVFTIKLLRLRKSRRAIALKSLSLFDEFGCANMTELEAMLEDHLFCFEQHTAALADCDEAEAKVKLAKQQLDFLDAETLKQLDFASGDGEFAQDSRRLAEAENSLRQIREEIANVEGRKSALGDYSALSETLENLLAEHQKLSEEFDALSLALDTLNEAAGEIQRRLAPEFSRTAAKYFSALTGSRYDALALDRQLSASVKLTDDAVSHEASYLSRGALEQLYLAVRLAICELALPSELPCPIILDDALANFDDERCKRALEVILEFSKKHQVLLFTCHSREAKFLESRQDVRILSV